MSDYHGVDLLPFRGGSGSGSGWPPTDYTEWHYVGQVTEPAFNDGFTNIPGNPRVGFRREAGKVFLSGQVNVDVEVATVDPVFVLPAGYRPDVRQTILSYENASPYAVHDGWVETNGEVYVQVNEVDIVRLWVPGSSWFWLEGAELAV